MALEKATEIPVSGINPCHVFSTDMKALKMLNFTYKETIQHENINAGEFTGELVFLRMESGLLY